jgi:hypothetical protein
MIEIVVAARVRLITVRELAAARRTAPEWIVCHHGCRRTDVFVARAVATAGL